MSAILLGRICRTCLLESSTMHKLLEQGGEQQLPIEEMLHKTIPNFELPVEDLDVCLPVEICEECLEKLTIAYDFQQMCFASNEKLQNLIQEQQHHDELEDVIMVAQGDAASDKEDHLDLSGKESLKLEPEDEFVQNALERLVAAHKEGEEEIHSMDLLDNGEEEKNAEIKLELEAMANRTREDFEDFHNVGEDEDDDDEEFFPQNDHDNDTDNSVNEEEEEQQQQQPKENQKTRRYKKRRSSCNEANDKVCPHCNKVFQKRNLLTRHMSVHNEDYEFVCDTCQYRFPTAKLLKVHISYKHNRGVTLSLSGGPYPCPDCSMVFQQTRALAAHRVIHAERDFKCQVCGVNLKTLSAVTRHMNHKHPGVLPYKCELCDQAFPVESHYKDHLNMHKGYKKHKCEQCDKSFPNSTALKDHERSHTGECPYLCSHCGKSFKTSNILRQHLQRHGEKNFQCPECPMRFYVKVNLQKHMCTHSKEKPFVCDTCGSSFTRGDSLKAHRFKHTGERPFKCEECNMSFVFKRHLLRHKVTHTGEKKHMCTYCDRAYAASGDLVKHLRTHLGEKTYLCDECPQAFKYHLDLRDHKNQHYKEKHGMTDAAMHVEEVVESIEPEHNS
ncbi:gastrula zinc finger protein XlCGF57.1-like [Musca vetustissima]|uniref:gastrula zinc finger protein XlCGF57.1-like n=1 Tax=Musca vetustissima TaxID=27455 RepID=UPI002AB5E654|nr:gastrula zinc finger protein XlCGF57.1-like [Musca vetustissima]